MYLLRLSLFLSPLEGLGSYARNFINSVHVEREGKHGKKREKESGRRWRFAILDES